MGTILIKTVLLRTPLYFYFNFFLCHDELDNMCLIHFLINQSISWLGQHHTNGCFNLFPNYIVGSFNFISDLAICNLHNADKGAMKKYQTFFLELN